MKLIEKIAQNRRDFQGKYECQSCGHIEVDNGLRSYDDDYFHDEVIPSMRCEQCGESTFSLDLPNERMATRYAPHEVV